MRRCCGACFGLAVCFRTDSLYSSARAVLLRTPRNGVRRVYVPCVSRLRVYCGRSVLLYTLAQFACRAVLFYLRVSDCAARRRGARGVAVLPHRQGHARAGNGVQRLCVYLRGARFVLPKEFCGVCGQFGRGVLRAAVGQADKAQTEIA